jgi:hypothetical protein
VIETLLSLSYNKERETGRKEKGMIPMRRWTKIAALAAVLVLSAAMVTGCGDGTDTTTSTVSLAMPEATGDLSDVVGTWSITTYIVDGVEKTPAEYAAELGMTETEAQMTLTINADGSGSGTVATAESDLTFAVADGELYYNGNDTTAKLTINEDGTLSAENDNVTIVMTKDA